MSGEQVQVQPHSPHTSTTAYACARTYLRGGPLGEAFLEPLLQLFVDRQDVLEVREDEREFLGLEHVAHRYHEVDRRAQRTDVAPLRAQDLERDLCGRR